MPDAQNHKVFETQIKIRFREADPAGILFFGNILGLAHDAFEDFLSANGVLWNDWFKPVQWACPIRHSEVDYLSPFTPGQKQSVKMDVSSISKSSFQMRYEFANEEKKICARVLIVHTFVDQKTFQKVDIPERYRKLFESYHHTEK